MKKLVKPVKEELFNEKVAQLLCDNSAKGKSCDCANDSGSDIENENEILF